MFLLLSAVLAGAPTPPPAPLDVPPSGLTATDFAPKGWTVERSVPGELNGDATPDLIVVLLQDGEVDRRRALLWLHGAKKGLTLVARNETLLACFGCLGIKGGDGTPSIEIAKRVVSIEQEGGSREIWSNTHRFRFEGKAVSLIGVDRFTADTLTGASSKVSRNLLTGLTVVEQTPPELGEDGKPTGLKPSKKSSKSKPKPLVRFADVTDASP